MGFHACLSDPTARERSRSEAVCETCMIVTYAWHSIVREKHGVWQVEHSAARWKGSERLLCAKLHTGRAEDALRQAGHSGEGSVFGTYVQVKT